MKKNFSLLIILLVSAYSGFAQDTLTGVVSRVAAPYFEQNVCDTRFVLTTGDETYYVMVDNYWPNPYLEDLVIHYDTVPVGNEIEVVGTIVEMEDENGDSFNVFNIQELIHATYYYGIGFINWTNQYATVCCNLPPYNVCYISINGELQTEYPIVFNGLMLGDIRYTIIGIAETLPNYTFPILELTQAIPYDIETTTTGVIVANNELHLTMPLDDKRYLSWSDYEGIHYITNNDRLLEDNFYSIIWGENVNSTIKGFENIHYDIFGAPFNTFEIIELETVAERSIIGQISTATAPPIGPYPAITQRLVISFNGYNYYIDNQQDWNENNCFVGNDTVPLFSDVTASFSLSSLFLGGNIPTPYFNIHIEEIEVCTSKVEDIIISSFAVFPNPSNGIIEITSERAINNIFAYNSIGKMIINKTNCSHHNKLDLRDYHGLIVLIIDFQDGHKTTVKEVIR